LATGVTAPKAEVTAEADYQGQTRSADTFLLPASAAGDIPAGFFPAAGTCACAAVAALNATATTPTKNPLPMANGTPPPYQGQPRNRPNAARVGRCFPLSRLRT